MSSEWISDVIINDLELIQAVQEHRHLYDKRDLNFYNSKLVDATWAQIGKQFADDFGWACQWRWTSLRNQYRDAVRRRRFLEVARMPSAPKWKYEDAMSFLEPHLTENRPQPTPTPVPESDDAKVQVPQWRRVSELVALFKGGTVVDGKPSRKSAPAFPGTPDSAISAKAYLPAKLPDLVPATPVAPEPESPPSSEPDSEDLIPTVPKLTPESEDSEDSGFEPELAVEVNPESESSEVSTSASSSEKVPERVQMPTRFLHPHLMRNFRHRIPTTAVQRDVIKKPAPPPVPVIPRVCQVQNAPVTSRGLTCAMPNPRPANVGTVAGALKWVLSRKKTAKALQR
nr:PREDICTED: protein app1-like [Bemisia tabaci]